MMYSIFKFELSYRFKRVSTFLYLFLLFLISFLSVTTNLEIGGGAGQLKENSPAILTYVMLVISAFFMVITSSIMGVPVLRDVEHRTASLFFVNPITKLDYLLGRFLGSFVILLFVFSGMLWGFILGDLMPFRDAANMAPFDAWSYIHIFIVFILPNLFFTGALFFSSGALSGKTIAVYTQGIVLLVFYLLSLQFMSSLNDMTLAAITDPFAIITFQVYSQYWTVAEQNSMLVPLAGVVLYNRLLWVTLGVLCLLITHKFYKFGRTSSKAPYLKKREPIKTAGRDSIPSFLTTEGTPHTTSVLHRIFLQSFFYFRMITKEVSFLAISICGLAVMFYGFATFSDMYGVRSYPTTQLILELIDSFDVFFIIIVVFFAGELMWKERTAGIDAISDAMPTNSYEVLLSKFLGLLFACIGLLFVLMICGVLAQTLQGYFNLEVKLYFMKLFTESLFLIILFAILSLFVHTIVSNRFIGYAIIVSFFLLVKVMPQLGLEHGLFQFAGAKIGMYSDMNGYGHFLEKFMWYSLYWIGFASVLFTVSFLMIRRGNYDSQQYRLWNLTSRNGLLLLVPSLVVTLAAGAYIFYNTTIINSFYSGDELQTQRANYEKDLKQFQHIEHPMLTAISMKVDLYPSRRHFDAAGRYTLVNKSKKPISEVHVQLNTSRYLELKELTFNKASKLLKHYEEHGYIIYKLESELHPNDSLKMDFAMSFLAEGFVDNFENTDVVHNGTFFGNHYFPSLGYNEQYELSSKRQDYGLQPKHAVKSEDLTVRSGVRKNLYGDDADYVSLDLVIGTDNGQTAIAPGNLLREWEEGGRSYFRYKTDKPMINFYAIASGQYQKLEDTVTVMGKNIKLEIYYHDGHAYNVNNMMTSMKKSLHYYSRNYSLYPFDQLRLVEFPRYRKSAQSFSNTILFSEGMGFLFDSKKEDLDVVFAVTAHEVAHQWWGHQIAPASVAGYGMLTETLAQYSAMMVLKETYPAHQLQKFLRHDLDKYLKGRANEKYGEQALSKVGSREYIRYNKGALAMYALHDYIGEEKLNGALQEFIRDWAYKEEVYPTANDLMSYLAKVTPDSLGYILHDLFEDIILYENKAVSTNFTRLEDNTYQVAIKVAAMKLSSDERGNTTEIPMNDWIDIGVYQDNRLLYLQKHKVKSGENDILVRVSERPTKAGIDPLHKLIDRTSTDNVVPAKVMSN